MTLSALLLTSILLSVIMAAKSPKAEYVLITCNGKEMVRLSLSEETTYNIGSGNVIEISDGEVSMKEADCPDKICIHTGKISREGQSIVCLPNRVVVTIVGEDNGTDVLTY